MPSIDNSVDERNKMSNLLIDALLSMDVYFIKGDKVESSRFECIKEIHIDNGKVEAVLEGGDDQPFTLCNPSGSNEFDIEGSGKPFKLKGPSNNDPIQSVTIDHITPMSKILRAPGSYPLLNELSQRIRQYIPLYDTKVNSKNFATFQRSLMPSNGKKGASMLAQVPFEEIKQLVLAAYDEIAYKGSPFFEFQLTDYIYNQSKGNHDPHTKRQKTQTK